MRLRDHREEERLEFSRMLPQQEDRIYVMELLQMDMYQLDQRLTAYLPQQEVEDEAEDAEEAQRRSMVPVPSRQSNECI